MCMYTWFSIMTMLFVYMVMCGKWDNTGFVLSRILLYFALRIGFVFNHDFHITNLR